MNIEPILKEFAVSLNKLKEDAENLFEGKIQKIIVTLVKEASDSLAKQKIKDKDKFMNSLSDYVYPKLEEAIELLTDVKAQVENSKF